MKIAQKIWVHTHNIHLLLMCMSTVGAGTSYPGHKSSKPSLRKKNPHPSHLERSFAWLYPRAEATWKPNQRYGVVLGPSDRHHTKLSDQHGSWFQYNSIMLTCHRSFYNYNRFMSLSLHSSSRLPSLHSERTLSAQNAFLSLSLSLEQLLKFSFNRRKNMVRYTGETVYFRW